MAVIRINKENFASEVLHSEKVVLLDFYADWCDPCRMVGPIVEEIANARSDIKVGKIQRQGSSSLLYHINNQILIHSLLKIQKRERLRRKLCSLYTILICNHSLD